MHAHVSPERRVLFPHAWFRAIFLWRWILVSGMILGLASCSQEAERDYGRSEGLTQNSGEMSGEAKVVSVPAEFQHGEQLYGKFCAGCHGVSGNGSSQGPPLVHKIYEPSHHADHAFIRAAAQGVRAHHWKFGNMPKIEGVTPAEVQEIIGYIRWLQREAGIT